MSAEACRRQSSLKLLAVGVGGQGVVTLARILGDAATLAGVHVRVGQLHGMSQRGGSVLATVLFGLGDSSFVADGNADVLVALEPLELKRARPKLSARTRVIASSGRTVPFTLVQQGLNYPAVDEIFSEIRSMVRTLAVIDGPALTRASGSRRALNIVMLGALAGLEALPFPSDGLWQAIERLSPSRFVDANRRAFELGCAAVA